jgi:hypothetical protein
MKILFLVGMLFTGASYAGCQNVYDAMSGKFVYVCTQDPAPQPPQCHNEYDAMNGKWVLVCH